MIQPPKRKLASLRLILYFLLLEAANNGTANATLRLMRGYC